MDADPLSHIYEQQQSFNLSIPLEFDGLLSPERCCLQLVKLCTNSLSGKLTVLKVDRPPDETCSLLMGNSILMRRRATLLGWRGYHQRRGPGVWSSEMVLMKVLGVHVWRRETTERGV